MIGRVQRTWGRIRRWRAHRPMILMYHRVAALAADPWELSVSPRHFAEQIAVLREWGHLFSLQQLLHRHEAGTLPPRSVAITFDDGYADNLHTAKPILEKYEVPATFFLPANSIGRVREFWWDELERIFLQSESLPGTLRLTVEGVKYGWTLEADAARAPQTARLHASNHTTEAPPTRRHLIYRAIWKLLRRRNESQQQEILAHLRSWAGTSETARPTHRTLTRSEARKLAEGERFEIGAHTLTHASLDVLDPSAQQSEIWRCKQRLEALLGGAITSFAYPYGAYGKETARIVRDVGFERACTTEHRCLQRYADRFTLPRMHVQDVGYETFIQQVQRTMA